MFCCFKLLLSTWRWEWCCWGGGARRSNNVFSPPWKKDFVVSNCCYVQCTWRWEWCCLGGAYADGQKWPSLTHTHSRTMAVKLVRTFSFFSVAMKHLEERSSWMRCWEPFKTFAEILLHLFWCAFWNLRNLIIYPRKWWIFKGKVIKQNNEEGVRPNIFYSLAGTVNKS